MSLPQRCSQRSNSSNNVDRNNKKGVTTSSSNDNKSNNCMSKPTSKRQTTSKQDNPPNLTKIQKEWTTLSRELEIAEYATVGHGHAKRKTPRRIMKERTKKRKLLEREDRLNQYEQDHGYDNDHGECDNQHSSTNSSSNAGEKSSLVHETSMLFDKVVQTVEHDDEDDNDDLEEEADNDDVDEFQEAIDEDEVDVDEVDADFDVNAIDDDDEEQEDGDFRDDEKRQFQSSTISKLTCKRTSSSVECTKTGKIDAKLGVSRKKSIQRKVHHKKRHYRMRNNLKSQRLAERHGEALGAHSRGLPLVAIRKLSQVAMNAPTAPQVYTSLGMIYEDMMKQEEESNWNERLQLAKKAYGSYHIAAVLCKKDYMVWVRAADTARGVADLYTVAMLQQQQGRQQEQLENTCSNDPEPPFRALKRHWVQEAQKDYQTAANLKPPGLDIPAKLAAAHMELGNLSEALAIMTDLKNKPGHTHKTWMLYAELMLRIGFECQQWNAGDQYVMNFNFRRWLRKYSTLFDWQERRLQALALALEAAVGTTNCRKLMEWTLERAKEKYEESLGRIDDSQEGNLRWCMDTYEMQLKDEVETTETADGDLELRQPFEEDVKNDDVCSSERSNFEAIRSSLFSEAKIDSPLFDRKVRLAHSNEIGLQNFDTQADMEPEGEHVGKTVQATESKSAELPMSASCATVCGIASELIKHCLGLEQYKGGRLAAECVSFYFKARAASRDVHVKLNMAFEAKQKSTSSDILLNPEAYDEIVEGSDASDDDLFLDYFSDEEMLDSDPQLLKHLSRGILPPELQVLFALCLIGEGGQDFLAAKCINAISALSDDTLDSLDRTIADLDVIPNPAWQVYQHAMTDELATIPALAFVADMLKNAHKESEWAPRISHLFQNAIGAMQSVGLVDEALETEKSKAPNTALRRTQILKIVLAGARYCVWLCKRQLADTDNPSSAVATCVDVVESVTQRLWRVDKNGSPSKSSVEALQVFATTLPLLDQAGSIRQHILAKLEGLARRMVGCRVKLAHSVATVEEPNWASFPFSASWQDDNNRSLSVRVHNLCVANCVALFSGWENSEFTLDLMRRHRKNNYFGLTLFEGRIVGYLDKNSAGRLADAWTVANGVVGTTIDVIDSLEKASSFLEHDNYVARPLDDGEDVAIYGEREALAVFIEYAKQCLTFATTKDAEERSKLIKIGMSILLTITQFSVLNPVWESNLGRATGALSGLDDWRTLTVTKPITQETEPVGPKPLRKHQRRSIKQWHQTELSLIGRIVVIPTKNLLAEWSGDCNDPSLPKASLTELQSKLHGAMCQLRSSTTELALQKASLQVTAILLAMIPHIHNPFLVIQHAALFASQCSKGGNIDLHFKTELPLLEDCTPLQALTILARAECLQAVHFAQEATFLCSFVVRCCHWHRCGSLLDEDERTSRRWKVVGIHAYNLAMAIRSIICATQQDKDSQSKALEVWDDQVLGELERCRCDAIAMRRETLGDQGSNQNEDGGNDDANVTSAQTSHFDDMMVHFEEAEEAVVEQSLPPPAQLSALDENCSGI